MPNSVPKSSKKRDSSPRRSGSARQVEVFPPPTVSPPPIVEYEVATVNAQGQIRDRQTCQAEYRTEALGKGVSLELAKIPAGEFMMGAPDGEVGRSDDEGPHHRVSVSAFWMSKHPVTQDQWKVVAGFPKVERDLDADPSKFNTDFHGTLSNQRL